ncbi:uncharacterized protein METZ01_LOCUS243739 [marine metagenome]|uniref:Uncharacterized protein n=1 Tax=marine metagenome TaxID=408172 RepID=A0A382HUU2_9ZZZZ
MNKKIIVILCIVVVLIVGLTGMSNSGMDKTMISQTIFVDAVYKPENNVVSITYTDNSNMTKLVTLEILGMEKTFHKEFSQQSFIETVQINSIPQYGWATMPVTFTLDHEKFGKVGLKTEIHLSEEMKPKVIYSKI